MVNTRDKRALKLDILRRQKNERALQEKMENYVSGITEAPLTSVEGIDEQLQNYAVVNRKLADETYKIFNGDPQQSEEFLDLMRTNGISYSDFIKVSDDLINRFRGKLVLAPSVYRNMKQLIDNVNATGTTQATRQNTAKFDELKDYIDALYNAKKITKAQGDNAKDLIDATLYATTIDFKTKYEEAMQNNNLLNRQVLKAEIKELMDINSLQDNDVNKPGKLLDLLYKIRNIIETEINGAVVKVQKKATDKLDKTMKKIDEEKDLTDMQKSLKGKTRQQLKTILGVINFYNYKEGDNSNDLRVLVETELNKISKKKLKKIMSENPISFTSISELNKDELLNRLINLQYSKK
jgi:hypothetical protein